MWGWIVFAFVAGFVSGYWAWDYYRVRRSALPAPPLKGVGKLCISLRSWDLKEEHSVMILNGLEYPVSMTKAHGRGPASIYEFVKIHDGRGFYRERVEK